MKIVVKLFATFRNGRFKIEEQEHQPESSCRMIILSLGLTEKEIGVVMINGRHAPLDQLLHDGDTLALFPLIGGG